jgi:hypothetical protein
MGVLRQIGNCRPAWNVAEESLARWVMENTPKDAVFFVLPAMPRHPVSVLAGRALWNSAGEVMELVGVNGTDRLMDVRRLTLGEEVFLSGVTHMVVGDPAINMEGPVWKEVHSVRDYTVYERVANRSVS